MIERAIGTKYRTYKFSLFFWLLFGFRVRRVLMWLILTLSGYLRSVKSARLLFYENGLKCTTIEAMLEISHRPKDGEIFFLFPKTEFVHSAVKSVYLFFLFCYSETIVRSSVTRTPQIEKAAIQASSKITDKVPGAVIMVDEEKENSSGELSSPVAPLAVQESFEERAKPATTPANTTTSVPTSTKDNSPRVVIISIVVKYARFCCKGFDLIRFSSQDFVKWTPVTSTTSTSHRCGRFAVFAITAIGSDD